VLALIFFFTILLALNFMYALYPKIFYQAPNLSCVSISFLFLFCVIMD
jgi:hypothetical protein